eukprot:TRINITY_DN3612_c0_g1_i1.p1 TRINITY_DN3612_c0_g1~~TRINITY_DN3612_c0_g1_i1.p1  ORF type:complete len:375 (-),score=62.80 TRINITY_DN3612_c0_g1_i1:252-1376(-)
MAPQPAARASPFDIGSEASAPGAPRLSPFDLGTAGPSCGHAGGEVTPSVHSPAELKEPVQPAQPPQTPQAQIVPAQSPQPPLVDFAPDVHREGTRYFVITSNTKDNVVKSVRHGLWATQRKNEARLDEAFREAPAVVLVFSVNRSEAFQGYAIMRSQIGRPQSKATDPFNGFGRLFDVEWRRLHDLHYREVEHLRNPLNGDQLVKYSRDGQELTNGLGQRLCGLIDRHIDEPESFPNSQAGHGAASQQPQQMQPPPQILPAAEMQPLAIMPGPPPPLPEAAVAPETGAGPFPGAMPGTWPRESSSDSSEGSDDPNAGPKKKKIRHSPHALSAGFHDQLDFFLKLDYDEYFEWWKRQSHDSPGPALPGTIPPPVG